MRPPVVLRRLTHDLLDEADLISGDRITHQTTSEIVDKILSLPPKTRLMLLAPVVRDQKGEFRDVIERLGREGAVRYIMIVARKRGRSLPQ